MCRISTVVGLLWSIIFTTALASGAELKLVNVAFRHGARTPATSSGETYPNDPYKNNTYYPMGSGELTNEGKRQEYHLGEVLKSLYGEFLGPIYYPTVLEARSTIDDRAKMSLQLVLSGLYPPTKLQMWNEHLLWQPIPTTYLPVAEDTLLFAIAQTQYLTEYQRVKNSSEVIQKVAEFGDLMKSLGNYTGLNITDPSTFVTLYDTFKAQEAVGLTLPDWVSEFYPDGELTEGARFYYQLMSYNDELKRLNGGMLVSKILSDASSFVNGTLAEGRKLFLYSGHDVNVAALELALGVRKPHMPAYSSAVIVELWEDEGEYYFKVLYHTGIPSEIIPLQIPGCSELCFMDKFVELLRSVTTT